MSVATKAIFSMFLKPSSQLLTGKLTFYDRTNKQINTFVATSGQPGYQTPEHYRTKRKGLCPPYKGLKIQTAGYPLNTIGVEGMFYPLSPDPIPGYGRSEIGLHRDSNYHSSPGSAGCIVVINSESFNNAVVPLLNLSLKAGIKFIDLNIDYATENSPSSGGNLQTIRSNEIDILARTMFGEARGEGIEGQIAVAWVIRNRASSGGWWGDDIAEVCLKPYQFSCWNKSDPNSKLIAMVDDQNSLFNRCLELAAKVVTGELPDPTSGANHYHADSIFPSWAKGRKAIAHIGNHVFYKL